MSVDALRGAGTERILKYTKSMLSVCIEVNDDERKRKGAKEDKCHNRDLK